MAQKGKEESPPKEKGNSEEEIEEEIKADEKPTNSEEDEPKWKERQRLKKEKLPFPEIPPELAHHTPPVPFPQRLKKQNQDKQFSKFIDIFKKLHINIPFADALQQMPSYAKFLKDILSNKRKLEDEETVMLTEECSAILQKKLPPKLRDPGSFTIPCVIGDITFDRVLCDLGASINLMPFSVFRRLGIGEVKPTSILLQLADRSIKHPRGIVEDVLVKVDKFIFPADFVVLDMEEDKEIPLILGRPFLATGRTLIDVQEGKLIMRMQDEEVTFNVLKDLRCPPKHDSCFKINSVDQSEMRSDKSKDSCTRASKPKVEQQRSAKKGIILAPSQFKNHSERSIYRRGVDDNDRIKKRMTNGWKWVVKLSTRIQCESNHQKVKLHSEENGWGKIYLDCPD